MAKQKTKDEGYVSVATKVPNHVAELLTILARMRGMEVYELLQLLVNGFISYAKAETSVPDEFRHLYESLKFDVAWNRAFNFASPTATSEIAQMVLILQQPGKNGFGLMMIDKPFIDEAISTLSIPLIVGRVLELSLGIDDFKRLRGMVATHQSTDPLDMIRLMLDDQEIIDIEESNRRELPGHGEHHDSGKVIEYGNKTKRIHHRTPDSIAQQQKIIFDDYDREVADMEVQDWEGEHRQHGDDLPEGMTRPFDQEW
jgi:hypothetical protein